MTQSGSYNKIHWWNLPLDQFSVDISKKFLKEMYNSIEMLNSKEKFFEYLIKKCNTFKLKSRGSAKTKFYQILDKKYPIPLDLLLELSKLSNTKLKVVESKINKIACLYFKEKLQIKFPIIYDENFTVISEIIRSEGNISKDFNSIQLGNSDTRIINQFLFALLKKFKIDKDKVIKALHTKISFLEGNKKDIKVTNSKEDNIPFFIVDKVLKNEIKKQIIIMDYNPYQNNTYSIKYNENIILANIIIPKAGLIQATSTFDKYKSNITSSLNIRVNNKTLTKLLHYIAEIPEGKKSHLIYIPKILKLSPISVLSKAFEVTFKCEGNIDKDQIRIKSISKSYLEDWREILSSKFNIKSNIYGDTLAIANKENFIKFFNSFDLLEEEGKQLKNMLKRRSKLPQRQADSFYLSQINRYGSLTSRQLANITKRTQACTKRQLTSLYFRGLIDRRVIWKQGGIVRYEYFMKNPVTRYNLKEVASIST